MATTPAQRLERLRRNALRGWDAVRRDPSARRACDAWLDRFPSALPEVDRLWREALAGNGQVAR